jgi:hypothetical protein
MEAPTARGTAARIIGAAQQADIPSRAGGGTAWKSRAAEDFALNP